MKFLIVFALFAVAAAAPGHLFGEHADTSFAYAAPALSYHAAPAVHYAAAPAVVKTVAAAPAAQSYSTFTTKVVHQPEVVKVAAAAPALVKTVAAAPAVQLAAAPAVTYAHAAPAVVKYAAAPAVSYEAAPLSLHGWDKY